jgi:hypothetical protein
MKPTTAAHDGQDQGRGGALRTWLAVALAASGMVWSAGALAAFSTSEGWRLGVVERIVTAHEATDLVAANHDCRRDEAWQGDQNQRWALVSYRRVPGHVYRVIPLAQGQQAQKGQAVYVQVNACRVAAQPG